MFGVFIFTVCTGIKNMLKSGGMADLVYNLDSWGTWSYLPSQSQCVLSELRVVLCCYNVLDGCQVMARMFWVVSYWPMSQKAHSKFLVFLVYGVCVQPILSSVNIIIQKCSRSTTTTVPHNLCLHLFLQHKGLGMSNALKFIQISNH